MPVSKNSDKSKEPFSKIKNRTEKEKIFFDIAQAKALIVGKTTEPDSSLVSLQASLYASGKLYCTTTSPLPAPGEMTFQVLLGGEKYIWLSTCEIKKDLVVIALDAEVFHVQRREDYRIRLPQNFPAVFACENHKYKLVDLSGGGFRILIRPTPPSFDIGDEVSGELQLPDRQPLKICGVVVHEKDDEVHREQTLGVQFIGLSEIDKNRLVAIVMDLYRQLFARINTKK